MESILISRGRLYSLQVKDRPCSVPYSLHKILKEEKVGLEWQWARPLDRNDLPKNEFVFSIYLIDGQPTIRNPTLSL